MAVANSISDEDTDHVVKKAEKDGKKYAVDQMSKQNNPVIKGVGKGLKKIQDADKKAKKVEKTAEDFEKMKNHFNK